MQVYGHNPFPYLHILPSLLFIISYFEVLAILMQYKVVINEKLEFLRGQLFVSFQVFVYFSLYLEIWPY